MRNLILAVPVLLLITLPSHAVPPPPLDLEETCLKADLIVVGILGEDEQVAPAKEGSSYLKISATMQVQKVLFGIVPTTGIPVSWHRSEPRKRPLPACTDGSALEGGKAKTRTWCLTLHSDGTYTATFHPNHLEGLQDRPAIEKAIQARLAPDAKTLEQAKDVVIGFMEPAGTKNPGASQPPETEAGKACKRLAEAGPAARPVAQALLKHESAIARAWGCRLAHVQNDLSLLPLLAPLLDDGAEVAVDDPDYPKTLPLSQIAVWTVAGFAGKSGKPFTLEEAKAWCRDFEKRFLPLFRHDIPAPFIRGKGTVRFFNLEGGFFGIVMDDGAHLLPMGPVSARGRVYVEACPAPNAATTAMWGRPVRIVRIEALPKEAPEKNVEGKGDPVSVKTPTQALEIALAYLKEQPWAGQYLPESACATETAEGWDVTIKPVDWQTVRRAPSTGLIRVGKATGQAKWIPQE